MMISKLFLMPLCLLVAQFLVTGQEEEALRVAAGQSQLFVDNRLVQTAERVVRRAHQAEKFYPNPVLTFTEPWEDYCVITWGSVLYDEQEKVFKCWYQVYRQNAPRAEQASLCYATSTDGIHWRKPKLGIVGFQGSKENNMILHPAAGDYPSDTFDSAVVLKDERDPDPARRYKMMLYWREKGLHLAHSADGIHWDFSGPTLVKAGDRSAFFYNPFRKSYVFLSRPGKPAPETGVVRWIGLWESPDLKSFGEMRPVLWPDSQDAPGTEFYSLQPFVYESAVLGYLEMFYNGKNDPRFRRLDTQLATSSDGLRWERAVEREVILPYGPVGSWDGGWVCPSSNPPIRHKDRLYVHYQGRRSFHWGTQPKSFEQEGITYQINDPEFGHVGSVGLAFLRVDGFASMAASGTPGVLTTRPMVVPPAEDLIINAEAKGRIRVGIADAKGRTLSGYSVEDCEAFSGNELAHTLRWRGERDIRELTGKTIRLQFHLENADLYSFRFQSLRTTS